MKYRLVLIYILLVAILAGCGQNGFFRDRSHDYLNAKDGKQLQIPNQVAETTASSSSLLPIPDDIAQIKAGKAQTVERPTPANQQEELQEFIMQQGEGGAWLLVLRDPAQIWVTTYNLLTSLDFKILESANQQAGEINTSVLAINKVNQALVKQQQATLVSNNADVALNVKINRGIQPNSSEIYIKVYVESNKNKLNRDNQLEVQFLNILQNSLQQQKNVEVSLLASQYFTGYNLPSLERDAQNMPYLSFNTDFDRTWAYLNHAIGNTEIKIDDINRSDGIFYVDVREQMPKPNFFMRLFASKKPMLYQLKITASDNKQLVTVKDAPEKVAIHVLDAIFQQLSN